jgi:phospholipid/cholesterol/gamma-HCH transport system ATP-binding protein
MAQQTLSEQPMVVMEDIKKSFGEKVVFDGLNLEVAKGETCVIIGRSGEGKSILLKHIIGLVAPDAGTITINGIELDPNDTEVLRRIRSHLGMLFQGAALFDSLTVRENVGFALDENSTLSPPEIDRIVAEKLELVNLHGIQEMMPSELSGGMKKRVGLARALATNPSLMLYDEPTTGLDPINADAINNLIISLRDKLDVTSLVVTHDIKSAVKVADRIAMLHGGRIIEQASPEEILRSSNPIVQQFITGSAEGPLSADEAS